MTTNSTYHSGNSIKLLTICFLIMLTCSYATCKYGFKDKAPIPEDIKTFRVNPFVNRAQYINPQLAPQLSEKLKQKIIGTTRLRQTNDDEAHYDISGEITQYYTSTSGISGNNASLNRLNVSVHLVFRNRHDEKKNFETDLTTNIDYASNLSLAQAEAANGTKIVSNIVDAIFNKIFSNW